MRIEHDFHIHTDLSLCADKNATVEHYIAKAKECGCKFIFGSDSHKNTGHEFFLKTVIFLQSFLN
ncbi:MAG: hypothetical protein J6C82_05685 [Clostridia bacterium]|nr:hypothetical protein [Clostridia bacterium]